MRVFEDRLIQEKCLVLRNHVLDSSNLQSNYETNAVFFKGKKLKEKILLGLVSWYLPEEVGFLIRFWLEENWGSEKKEWCRIIGTSKLYALTLILIQDEYSNRDFFGNIASKQYIERSISKVSIPRRNTTRIKRKIRRRGYQDHGSKRPSHLPEPIFFERDLKTVLDQEAENLILENKIFLLLLRIEDYLEINQAI